MHGERRTKDGSGNQKLCFLKKSKCVCKIALARKQGHYLLFKTLKVFFTVKYATVIFPSHLFVAGPFLFSDEEREGGGKEN